MEAQEWQAVVNRMPATWFPRETHGLLANYCRHQASVRKISQLIQRVEEADDFDFKAYARLLHLRGVESRLVVMLATKMRMTQKAEYDQHRRVKDDPAPMIDDSPWETIQEAA